MAGRKKTETVEAEVVETAVVPAGKMEFRLINPTEDGFLRRIQWNKEELEAAVRAKIAGYENVVYTEEKESRESISQSSVTDEALQLSWQESQKPPAGLSRE